MQDSEASCVSAEKSNLLTQERRTFRGIGDPYQTYQEKRRCNALQRQRAARLQSAARARSLAHESGQQEDGVEMRNDLAPEDLDETATGRAQPDAMEYADVEPSTSCSVNSIAAKGVSRTGRGSDDTSWRRQSGSSAGRGAGVRALGQGYGNELMQPEWMTDIPTDMSTNWLVMPRPEGMRCLLVTSRGRTVSWLRNGAPLHRFYSRLPGGSPATLAGCGGSGAAAAAASLDYCLLDCIFHSPNNTYYVQDLLCWRGYALYDTAAEFRTYWLHSKFQEEGLLQPDDATGGTSGSGATVNATAPPAAEVGSSGGIVSGGEGPQSGEDLQQQAPVSYRIVPLPVRSCTLQGLRAAYGRVPPPPAAAAATGTSVATNPCVGVVQAASACEDLHASGPEEAGMLRGVKAVEAATGFQLDFTQDGLYFLHRHGHYCHGPGTTPLALLWKDLGCSRYLVDTDANGQPLEHQAVVLTYRADRTVATEDNPPVVLGRLPEAFVAALGNKLRPGRLLRFTVRQGGIMFHEGRPVGADLHYEGPAHQRRGRADSFSKVLFQRLARTAPITASMMTAAVTASETAAATELLLPKIECMQVATITKGFAAPERGGMGGALSGDGGG